LDAVIEYDLKLVSREHDAEVQERSGGASNRKSIELGHFSCREMEGFVPRDCGSASSTVSPGGDLNDPVGHSRETPDESGRAVGRDRGTGETGSHEALLPARWRARDPVDGVVNDHKSTSCRAVLDLISAESEFHRLSAAEDTVLLGC
jgi:hypothetical protein